MADDADRDDIVRLVANMEVQNSAARYDWLYLSNPHGRPLTWLAVEKATGQAVACTSLFPRRVLVKGKERLGSIGGDCYVEPRVRRRGIATALHRASFEGMRARGIDFMYGPPAIHNLFALLKAGSHPVMDCERWVVPLSLRALYLMPALYRTGWNGIKTGFRGLLADLPDVARGRLARAGRQGMELEPIRAFTAEFDELFERIAPGYEIIGVRDREYLNWRYLATPARLQGPFAVRRGGELAGLVTLETAYERMSIIDLFTAPEPDIIDAALQAILDEAIARGCCAVDITCASRGPLPARLRARGFWRAAASGFQVAVCESDEQVATLLSPDAWHFMSADSDMDVTIARA